MSSPSATSSSRSSNGNTAEGYIRRYAAPIWDYLEAPDVIEIAVNPDETVWVERAGAAHMTKTDATITANAIRQLTNQIAGSHGIKSGRNNLITSAMLEVEGKPVRVQCVLPPACGGAGAITIRKFSEVAIPTHDIKILREASEDAVTEHLDAIKRIWDNPGSDVSVNPQPDGSGTDPSAQCSEFAEIAEIIIQNRLTVLVSGGTSSGKTTVLKALLAHVPREERIITIEDVPELLPDLPNYVPLIADRESTIRGPKQLLASVLRMRPDRFLVGELRGDEARVFLEAINTGHAGSLSTMHANSARKAINRLVLMGMGASANVSPRLMVSNICDTVDLILQCGKSENERGLVGYFDPSVHEVELLGKF